MMIPPIIERDDLHGMSHYSQQAILWAQVVLLAAFVLIAIVMGVRRFGWGFIGLGWLLKGCSGP